MAWIAAASTTPGTGVSQTPCARLIPPIRSHSVVMARISDWRAPGASWLNERRDAAAVVGIGEDPYFDILHFRRQSGTLYATRFILGYRISQVLVTDAPKTKRRTRNRMRRNPINSRSVPPRIRHGLVDHLEQLAPVKHLHKWRTLAVSRHHPDGRSVLNANPLTQRIVGL